MARMLFADEGSRLVYRTAGSSLSAAPGVAAVFYTDAAATALADLRVYDGTATPGATIAGASVTVDAYSRLPQFWGPDGVDTLWAVISGGPASPVYARTDDRLDALETGGADNTAAVAAEAVTRAAADTAEAAARTAADALLVPLSAVGVTVAPLDGGLKVPVANLPATVINDTFPVASQAAMLALTAQRGDVAIRSDLSKSFILSTDSPTTLADWLELLTPADAVTSVAGRGGAVVLAEADITGLVADLAGKAPLGAFTKTDTSAGTLDWINNSTSGYLAHLRTGPLSTSGVAAIGIGTDQGAGSGLLVSHKNSASGIILGVQPGAGPGMTITGRSISAPVLANLHPGSGAITVQVNTGANFADGTTTNGSTTFTSATAAFVAGDVGASLTQLTSRGLATDPLGCIPGGTTITAYISATQVTMSQPAQATGSTVLFAVSGRVMPATQPVFTVLNEVGSPLLAVGKGGLTLVGGAAGETPLKVTGTAGQTAAIFGAFISGNPTAALSVAANGTMNASFGTFATNAGLPGGAAQTNITYSSHPAIRVTRSASGITGDMLQAAAEGSSTPLTRINKEGFLMTRKAAAPPDADIATGELAFWFDATNGAAKLMIKAKQADGTVKTAALALA